MSDIKKKFFDILFEPEDEEIQADAPLNDIKRETFKSSVTPRLDSIKIDETSTLKKTVPNARDLLYGKTPKKSNTFIDVFEVPRKEKPVERVTPTNSDSYELRENVSPIFGPISTKEKKKKTVAEKEIQKAITNTTNNNEYTSVIISPIYGYDANKANDARRSLYDVKEQIYEEIERDNIEPAFDMFDNGTNETIQEAVEEAVIELAPVNRIKKQYSKKQKETKVEEKVKEEIKEKTIEEEPNLNITGEYVYEPIDEMEPFINKEETSEEEIEEENISDDTMSDVFDSFEAYEDETPSDEEEELTLDEATKTIEEATRSIYDTSPISLFDYDDIDSSDNTSSDIFNGLVKDED